MKLRFQDVLRKQYILRFWTPAPTSSGINCRFDDNLHPKTSNCTLVTSASEMVELVPTILLYFGRFIAKFTPKLLYFGPKTYIILFVGNYL